MPHKPASLSVVVPCHNEAEVLADTYRRIRAILGEMARAGEISSFEIVFVNNGSTDGTLALMRSFFEQDACVSIVDLRKNFGYQGSITAGLFHARKDMVVSIDADLQDDPGAMQDMVKKFYEGYEMVLGVRSDRRSDGVAKRLSAHAFYRLLNAIGIRSVYNHGDYRLLSRAVVEALRQYPERVRYLRGLIFEVEDRFACVSYTRAPRRAGTSKFTVTRLFSLALDGITSFSAAPIRLVTIAGAGMFLLSLAGLGFVLWAKYALRVSVPGWAFLAVAIFFFSGVQSLSMAIIGEYLAKLYLEAKQRPVYIVKKIYSHDQRDSANV